jgi:hypothetical protein
VIDRHRILRALARVAELLRARGAEGEICLRGGTVMVLAFNARASTNDVDAVFEPASAVREAAAQVAAEQALPEEWLNDGAKGFVSARHEAITGDLPQFDGLRVTAPTAEYILAMKCMSSRIGHAADAPGDVADIRFLIRHLGLRTADEALAIVGRYYPEGRIPARAGYLLEELFAEVRA